MLSCQGHSSNLGEVCAGDDETEAAQPAPASAAMQENGAHPLLPGRAVLKSPEGFICRKGPAQEPLKEQLIRVTMGGFAKAPRRPRADQARATGVRRGTCPAGSGRHRGLSPAQGTPGGSWQPLPAPSLGTGSGPPSSGTGPGHPPWERARYGAQLGAARLPNSPRAGHRRLSRGRGRGGHRSGKACGAGGLSCRRDHFFVSSDPFISEFITEYPELEGTHEDQRVQL